jgi:hypothetical protein
MQEIPEQCEQADYRTADQETDDPLRHRISTFAARCEARVANS